MSQNQDIQQRNEGGVAPTPQNTPLNTTVLSSRPAGMGKPTVEDVEENEDEEGEDVGGMNPASLLAQVCVISKILFWNKPRAKCETFLKFVVLSRT